jgi:hypothetical protein
MVAIRIGPISQYHTQYSMIGHSRLNTLDLKNNLKKQKNPKRWKVTLDTMFEKYNLNPKQIARQCSNRMENKFETKYKQNARQTWNSLKTNAIDLKQITNEMQQTWNNYKMQDRLETNYKMQDRLETNCKQNANRFETKYKQNAR